MSLWSSTRVSKSSVKKGGSWEKKIGSKKSENSSIKLTIIRGLVLWVRSSIYYEKSEAWISKIWWRRESEHSKDVLERIRVCEKSSLIILNLVFFFKCQMISSSSSNVWVVLPISMFMILFRFSSHGRCLAQVLVSRSHQSYCVPDFFCLLFSLDEFFAVSRIFDFYGILYCCTSIIWVIPNKTVTKINRRSVSPLSRALFGRLNSLKPGEAIALQIKGSLSDNKVSVFTNKSALHW